MFQWIYKLIGKEASKKLGLGDSMDTKKWYKSKTIWASIVTVILGGIGPISTAFGHPIAIPEWVISLLVGMGLYTARTATTDIK